MRTGDTVLHRPSKEEWLVAYVDGKYLAWCGWPEGEALVSDCELVKACSDEEHMKLLQDLAEVKPGRSADKRHRMARRILETSQ